MENKNNRPVSRQADDASPLEVVIEPSAAQTAALMAAFVQEQRAVNQSLLTQYQSIQQELAAIRQEQQRQWPILEQLGSYYCRSSSSSGSAAAASPSYSWDDQRKEPAVPHNHHQQQQPPEQQPPLFVHHEKPSVNPRRLLTDDAEQRGGV
jgi:hypothetical protein